MYMPKRPRRPFFIPYQPPTGLSGERPHASTEPSGAGFCSSAPPSGIQSPWALSMACRSSIARLSYLSCVPPTWQTIAGGSLASSRYIVYSEVPGGVLRTQGSSFVPLPAMAFLPFRCLVSFRNPTVTVAPADDARQRDVGWVSIPIAPVRRDGDGDAMSPR